MAGEMIPGRIVQIARTAALTSAVVALCLFAWNPGAGIGFTATSLWMIANLLLLALVLRIALGTEEHKRTGLFAWGLVGKFVLLGAGVAALFAFRPYTQPQVVGILAGVSSVLFVIIMKAMGAKVSHSLAESPAEAPKGAEAKQEGYDGTGARA